MTYFGFLLRFLAFPILVLLVMIGWNKKIHQPMPGFMNGRAVWSAILIHIILAVVYTTPWDNYLVATGVWYYNPRLVSGILLGYVPIEEYTFFVVETVLSGLVWWLLAARVPEPKEIFQPSKSARMLASGVVGFIWMMSAGLFWAGNRSLTYLSITLFWALPAVFAQLLYGADILWYHRKLVLPGVLVPGIYLSLADIAALRDTTWSISAAKTTGVLFFGVLPLEEAVFFFLTTILIVFGLSLLLSRIGSQRFKDWKSNNFHGLP